MTTLIFHSPIEANVCDNNEDVYIDDLNNRDIADAINENIDDDLAEYTRYPELVNSITMKAHYNSGHVYCETMVEITRDPTEKEISDIADEISGQFSDGWGEGFEQNPINVDGAEVYASFWARDNWKISCVNRNSINISIEHEPVPESTVEMIEIIGTSRLEEKTTNQIINEVESHITALIGFAEADYEMSIENDANEQAGDDKIRILQLKEALSLIQKSHK